MKFHIYQDRRGEWRWRLKARNGRIVADSGEGYKRRGGAQRAARAVHHALYWTTYTNVDHVVEPRDVD